VGQFCVARLGWITIPSLALEYAVMAHAPRRASFVPDSLHKRFSEDLQLTGKAERTQSAYLRAVRQLAEHCRCSPEDVTRGLVHVHRGKGAKDRVGPLPTSTLHLLRSYWATHRHKQFLFPADGRDHSLAKDGVSTAKTVMSETAAQEAIKKITTGIDFGKKVSIHTLRHSYATHLLEAGVSLKVIQKYMGHSSLATTLVYLHLTDTAEANAREVIEKIFRRK
jgi:site-specific recombinase XerD